VCKGVVQVRTTLKVILILGAIIFLVTGTHKSISAEYCDEPDSAGNLPAICPS